MKHKYWKIVTAFLLSFLFANLICFGVYRDAEWFSRDGGATSGIYTPFHRIIKADEGFAVTYADERGYINPGGELADDYVICFGNSMTNGNNVSMDKRYAGRLNELLSNGDDEIHAYVVANGGAGISKLVQGFGALVEEFPDSGAIIIQMYSLDPSDEMLSAYNSQRSYDETDDIDYLMDNASLSEKALGFMKEWLPAMAYLINTQLPNITGFENNAFFHGNSGLHEESKVPIIDEDEQIEQYTEVLSGMTSEYNGKLIFLYQPRINIDEKGAMHMADDIYYESFSEACLRCNVELCNMEDAFLEAYDENFIVPYGFSNTSMGTGHLNEAGHSIIADTLYEKYFAK